MGCFTLTKGLQKTKLPSYTLTFIGSNTFTTNLLSDVHLYSQLTSLSYNQRKIIPKTTITINLDSNGHFNGIPNNINDSNHSNLNIDSASKLIFNDITNNTTTNFLIHNSCRYLTINSTQNSIINIDCY